MTGDLKINNRLGCVTRCLRGGFPVSLSYCGLKHKVQGRASPITRSGPLFLPPNFVTSNGSSKMLDRGPGPVSDL